MFDIDYDAWLMRQDKWVDSEVPCPCCCGGDHPPEGVEVCPVCESTGWVHPMELPEEWRHELIDD
jgi:hypothetical protein